MLHEQVLQPVKAWMEIRGEDQELASADVAGELYQIVEILRLRKELSILNNEEL